MSPGALAILVPGSLALLGLFGNHALAMRRSLDYRGFWGAFLLAVLPAFLSSLWLTTSQGVSMNVRNVVLGLVGGVVGMVGTIWVGYIFSDFRAEAQSNFPSSAVGDTTSENKTIPTQNTAPVIGLKIIGDNQGADAATIISSGTPDQPSNGADIDVMATPGESATGLSVTQSGPGTGLRVIQNGPGTALHVRVQAGPSSSGQ